MDCACAGMIQDVVDCVCFGMVWDELSNGLCVLEQYQMWILCVFE